MTDSDGISEGERWWSAVGLRRAHPPDRRMSTTSWAEWSTRPREFGCTTTAANFAKGKKSIPSIFNFDDVILKEFAFQVRSGSKTRPGHLRKSAAGHQQRNRPRGLCRPPFAKVYLAEDDHQRRAPFALKAPAI